MKIICPIAGLLIIYSIVHAQENVDTAMMEKIKTEEKNNSQVAVIAHNITDVCGPRLTNSPGYNCALDWATQMCKSWGLQNAGREAWGEFGKGWRSNEATLALKAPYYENIIAYPVPWCKSTGKSITADLIMLNDLDFIAIDSAGSAVKGSAASRNCCSCICLQYSYARKNATAKAVAGSWKIRFRF